ITVALSENCENVVKICLEYIKERKKITSFDINFRAKLWSPDVARNKLSKILPSIDILLSSEADIDLLFKPKKGLKQKCQKLIDQFSLKLIALTRGPAPSYLLDVEGTEIFGKGYRPQLIDRIGAGDAYDAGILHGYLSDDLHMGLTYGEAMSALKFSIPGDFLIASKDEIVSFIQQEQLRLVR
ncbi:MAG: PfkB family carbohydrate kinase, partial [Candidatus Helarchaeota archaeon]